MAKNDQTTKIEESFEILGDIGDVTGVLQSGQKKKAFKSAPIDGLGDDKWGPKREHCEGMIMESGKWTLGEGYWKED